MSQWEHRWELLFNPNPSNQVEEIVFSQKNTETNYARVSFNNMIRKRESDLNPVFFL